ncbi:MAG: hypothetical protein IPJ34_39305 [Myxococcales bacterium]|nr:hypothetical protein [Myxococcales bacterium]
MWSRERPLIEAVAEAEVILPSNAPFDATVVQAATRACLIQQPAAGYENIDLGAAKARGLPVCNAPATNEVSVAEAALYLMLSLARRANEARVAFAAAAIGTPLGVELRGRTLVTVGRGRSAQALAGMARGLGMEVVLLGSDADADAWRDALARAHFVSLHCPLTPRTRGMFDDARFAQLRGAYLVNCARGAIVDRVALERALDRGHCRGVGLDVHWQEPWDPTDPFYARPEVVVLPHVAGSTEEAFDRVAAIVAENVARLTRGEPLLHRVV